MGWFSKISRRAGPSPAAANRKLPERLPADAPLLPLRARSAPRATDFPRFQSTASDQASSYQNDPATTARMRFRAAFTPSQPVVDRRMFAGRGEVLTAMIRSIEDQRLHTVIYGVRGIGKTSMLHVLSQAARDARYIVTYVSCGASSNLDETFRAIAGNIPLLFHSQFDPTTSEAETGATLKDLLGPAPVTVRVESIPAVGLRFSYPTESGFAYTLEIADTPDSTAWQPVQSTDGDGKPASIEVPFPANGQSFFRVATR